MVLRDIPLKQAYDSDEDDILNDFYVPALTNSTSYKRLAGFFSSTALAAAARALPALEGNDRVPSDKRHSLRAATARTQRYQKYHGIHKYRACHIRGGRERRVHRKGH